MNYEVDSIPLFDKQAKSLIKKYPSLKTELATLIDKLTVNPTQGIALSNNLYKIRLSVSSKGKGKSGGARIITFVKIAATTVYLTTIYDKSEKVSISNKELLKIIELVP